MSRAGRARRPISGDATAYLTIENFAAGVDRTRPRHSGPPGSIWSGINGHVTRGGDFERRKAFISTYALPSGTYGLAKTAAGLYVFGSAADPGVPSGITYQRLQHGANGMVGIVSWDLFAGLLYVIAEYDNGEIRHFYNGTMVSDWGAGTPNPAGYGTLARTHKRKLYSPIGSLLWFSELDIPNNIDTGASGSGFVNMSNHQSGSDSVTGLVTYQDRLAIFSRRVIQVWDMQDDDADNAPAQTLYETGTRSPRSVQGFGDLDAFYLSDSGVRSLRARNYTNIAGVNDVGTPIDTLIQEYMDDLTDDQIEEAVSITEPRDGRFWLKIGERIFVFSYFPSKKISAWSWYEPGLEFTDLVSFNGRVYARAGNNVYLYGGSDNAAYDDCAVTCALPFDKARKAAHFKHWNGVDIAAENTWNCKLLLDPNDETKYVDVGDLEGFTLLQEEAMAVGASPYCAPVLTCTASGYASLSQVILHYTGTEAKV